MDSIVSKGKRIFITGGSGYIGKEVVKEFLTNGYSVLALVRDEEKGKELTSFGAEYVVGDLSDVEILENSAKNCDGLIHCAMDYQSQDKVQKDKNCYETLIRIGKENSKTKKCTFVYTSGCIGIGTGEQEKDEFYEIDNSPEFAKWRMDNEPQILGQSQSEDTPNFTTVVIRPSWVYDSSAGFIFGWLKSCKKDNIVYYVGNGETFCNFIHNKDLAALYFLLVDQHHSGLFHATDNYPLKIKDIVEAVKKYLNAESKSLNYQEAFNIYGFAAFSQNFDQKMITKRAIEIGWKPTHESFLSALDELLKSIN